jgi:5'(3')-deoxyribonucleotidase
MAKRKPTLLLDCDEVLCSFTGGLKNTIKRAGIDVDLHESKTWDVFAHLEKSIPKGDLQHIYEEIKSVGFCANLDVCEGAVEAVKSLQAKGLDIVVVTSPWYGSTYWMGERHHWLMHHFGFDHHQIIQTSSKHRIKGDIFVDDKPENVQKSSDHNTWSGAFLWDTPFNQFDKKLRRIKGFEELLELFP